MGLSSSIFDFDFGTGFDDFGVEAFDDFGADFQRACRPLLLELTSSEPLTLDEEVHMQEEEVYPCHTRARSPLLNLDIVEDNRPSVAVASPLRIPLPSLRQSPLPFPCPSPAAVVLCAATAAAAGPPQPPPPPPWSNSPSYIGEERGSSILTTSIPAAAPS
jgi:hypothetical protein